MRCIAFCTSESYKLNQITLFCKDNGYVVKQYRKTLHIAHPNKKGDIFIFHYGCVVMWGLTRSAELEFLENIKSYAIHPLGVIESDRFVYRYGDNTEIITHDIFNADIIILESESVQIKLAISYGLAQSVQLESYESAVQKTIDENAHFPHELAEQGKLPLSQRDITKRMGKIFLARSFINLNSDYLEDPEYFWEHPNIEIYYAQAKKFLDIPRRVSALNQKLDILHELFEILSSQRQHRHANVLELTIILLIFIEIIISLVFKIF
jgi:uncharacterized Rmd1/YagE family protein